MTPKKPLTRQRKKPVRHFNKLSPEEAERLAVLQEELNEAGKAICKILRHGYESGWNGSNNRTDLTHELGDVFYAVALLRYAGDLDGDLDPYIAEKAACCPRFLHHQPRELVERVQRECTVED